MEKSKSLLYLGIEGGATNTVCVVMDSQCEVLGRSSGSGSNQYLIGIPAVASLIAELSKSALVSAGLPVPSTDSPPVFAALGACMSGALEKSVQATLVSHFRSNYPWLASHYYIDNDTPGSVYTAAGDAGGCVLIAGTGSMGQLIMPSGATVNCGGHGHMYGDGESVAHHTIFHHPFFFSLLFPKPHAFLLVHPSEGSAWSISSTAIRRVFAALDGYDVCEPAFYDPAAPLGDPRAPLKDTTALKAAMLGYFEISEPSGMLDVMYGAGFKKDRVAGFAKEVARLASEGDACAGELVAKAGRELGANLRALLVGSTRAGYAIPDVLSVVCVGSVWKSWELFKDSFVRAARSGGVGLKGFRLLRLNETSAVGSAWKAGIQAGHALRLDTSKLTTPLFEGK